MPKDELHIFEELFQKHYSSLLQYACKFILNKSIAEDILQEVFISVWINKKNIDFESESIKSYLFTSVRNKSLNYIESIKKALPFDKYDIDYLIQKEIFSYDPDDNLAFEELETEIKKCVDTLSPQCKKIFTYSRYKNLKNKEIAILLGITEKAVERQITKALTEIRKHLIKLNLLSLLFFIYNKIDF